MTAAGRPLGHHGRGRRAASRGQLRHHRPRHPGDRRDLRPGRPAAALVRRPGRFQIAGRWEEIDSERGALESAIHARTFAVIWFTKGHDRRIQFDVGEVHERPVDLDDNFYRLSSFLVF
jgi:hypothetical protein